MYIYTYISIRICIYTYMCIYARSLPWKARENSFRSGNAASWDPRRQEEDDALFIQPNVRVSCSVLHCVAVRCIVLRCVAACCSMLQNVARRE